ncbi:GNAT family N-acetyltransferase [Saccharopolyspora indica]|uniref:GNAT family N-acetyltransferase n=1 Tax=Saccharopolyspora indica TaxID=1229659 RepID=UPI0022EA6942|nr:GNAT family N-acetyltransferase [Saccharopolyspora indica]MDA3648657.1 GNAT family N-acetyltransferase [Saccharopolyspora indica]
MTAVPLDDALTQVLPGAVTRLFTPEDLAELVVLQRCCWVSEAVLNNTLDVPALHETHDEVLAWTQSWTTLVVRREGRLVAAVRGRLNGQDWEIGRLMVAPDLAGNGIGSALLALIEAQAPTSVRRFSLFTGAASQRNIRTYQRAGYQLAEAPHVPGHIAGAVFMTKPAT